MVALSQKRFVRNMVGFAMDSHICLGAHVHVHSWCLRQRHLYQCCSCSTIVLHMNEEEHTVPLEALESTAGLSLQKEEAGGGVATQG